MDQENFSSSSQQSNANMSRDTVEETIKTIKTKKLDLSISVVNNAPFAIPTTTTADSRPKQSVLTVDKPKLVSRPQSTPENKVLPARSTSSETRVSSARATTQPSFHNKIAATPTRPAQPAASEGKAVNFSHFFSSSSSPNENKSQNPMPSPPVNKIPANQSRVNPVHMSETKIPVSRSNQNMLSENKTPSRAAIGQRIVQNQPIIERKILSNESSNPTSPPEAKVYPSTARTGHHFIASQDNKPSPAQRVNVQKVAEAKNANQQHTLKQVECKTQINRVIHNAKVIPEPNQAKARQYGVKTDGKPNMGGNPPMMNVVENKTLKFVSTNIVEGGTTRTTQCKSTMRQQIHPNATGSETPTAVQTKMICTNVVTTKTICYQSVPAQPDKSLMLQGAKVSASSDMIQKTATSFDVSPENPHGNHMPGKIVTSKRATAVMASPAKKKCVKRQILINPGEVSSKSQDGSNMSAENGSENNEQFFNNLKTSRTGLTITPVRSATSLAPTTVANVRMPGEIMDRDMYRALERSQVMATQQRGKPRSRGRRKFVEPVCLTLSSDDEEEHMQAPFNSIEEAMNQAHMFPTESEGSRSGQSSPVYNDEENPESDDPQFPGVTDIHPKTNDGRIPYEEEEEEEDEEGREMEDMDMEEEEMEECEEEEEEMDELEMEEEDEEEVPPEDDEEEQMINSGPLENVTTIKLPLLCRSIRIGSYKIHPKVVNSVLKVYLAMDGISFNAYMVSDSSKMVNITLKPSDVTQLYVHFGKCLPILFVFTTPSFSETVRKTLNMTGPDFNYFDPNSNDERVKKITFLIDSITEEQRRFLRYSFVHEKKVRELDQKTANEILVKSTPSQTQLSYLRSEVPYQQENVISVTPLQPTLQVIKAAPVPVIPPPPPQPVTKLFTYPPPPQTGGITITTEDLACLNEGEFLNDAIIDFYLKYVFYEKLSDYHREKTHIFSSFFYQRLTQKLDRPRAGAEDAQKNVQFRRHSMVKTWTRHVDIFSKDFIVIPVNQNVHWFLAIICYPGLVPEATEAPPPKPDTKVNSKSNDNVTSTDDQEENKAAKEPNSSVDGSNQNLDENSTASSSSMFENEEPDSEEPMPEAPDSSTHPDKNRKRKEVPCICIFDSLNGPNRSRIVTMLREYLEVEWKSKKGTRKVFDKNTMQGHIMQCPQQNNYSDCGIYVLQYVESFFENPLPYFDSPIPNLSNWFTKEKVSKKRQELKDLIQSLKEKYSVILPRKPNTSDSVPSSPAPTLQTDNR